MQFFYTPLKSQNNDRWKAGSANTLSEEVVTLVCFISTPNNNWSDKEKDNRISDLIESHNWLIGQANNYNVELNLNYYILNNGNDVIFDQIEPGLASGKERVDWVYRTMIKLGYRNSKAAYKSLRKKYQAKNIQVLLYAKGKGRPYSMRYAKGISKKKYFLEGLIVFDRYNNYANMPTAAVTAHEILHLYGAWDLYRTYAQTNDRQQKAAELYPNLSSILKNGYLV